MAFWDHHAVAADSEPLRGPILSLPGHGPSPWLIADADFEAVVDALAPVVPFSRFALHVILGRGWRWRWRCDILSVSLSLTLIGVDRKSVISKRGSNDRSGKQSLVASASNDLASFVKVGVAAAVCVAAASFEQVSKRSG